MRVQCLGTNLVKSVCGQNPTGSSLGVIEPAGFFFSISHHIF